MTTGNRLNVRRAVGRTRLDVEDIEDMQTFPHDTIALCLGGTYGQGSGALSRITIDTSSNLEASVAKITKGALYYAEVSDSATVYGHVLNYDPTSAIQVQVGHVGVDLTAFAAAAQDCIVWFKRGEAASGVDSGYKWTTTEVIDGGDLYDLEYAQFVASGDDPASIRASLQGGWHPLIHLTLWASNGTSNEPGQIRFLHPFDTALDLGKDDSVASLGNSGSAGVSWGRLMDGNSISYDYDFGLPVGVVSRPAPVPGISHAIMRIIGQIAQMKDSNWTQGSDGLTAGGSVAWDDAPVSGLLQLGAGGDGAGLGPLATYYNVAGSFSDELFSRELICDAVVTTQSAPAINASMGPITLISRAYSDMAGLAPIANYGSLPSPPANAIGTAVLVVAYDPSSVVDISLKMTAVSRNGNVPIVGLISQQSMPASLHILGTTQSELWFVIKTIDSAGVGVSADVEVMAYAKVRG